MSINSVRDFCSWVSDNHGVSILDYCCFSNNTEKTMQLLSEQGLDGAVVYDPRYSQRESAKLEIICEDNLGMLLTGGTSGVSPIGTFGIDRTTFNKMLKRIDELT